MAMDASGASINVSRATLESVPVRVLTFLGAVARNKAVRGALAKFGYDAGDQKEGWRLLHHASGDFGADPTATDEKVADAIATIDGMDEDYFRIVRSALTRFANASDFVLGDGLAASVGPGAVLGMRTLQQRLDALESGKGRPARARDGDKAALRHLAKRGITKQRRDEVRALLTIAESMPDDDALGEVDAQELATSKRTKALYDAYLWWVEASGVAHTAIKRRDYLVQLGLAVRQARASGSSDSSSGASDPTASDSTSTDTTDTSTTATTEPPVTVTVSGPHSTVVSGGGSAPQTSKVMSKPAAANAKPTKTARKKAAP